MTIIRKVESFWSYVEKVTAKDKFIRMGFAEKEKIFLQWKWGSLDPNSNRDCEMSKQSIMSRMTENDLSGEDSEYWKTTLEFERACFKYKKEIGIGNIRSEKSADYQAKQVGSVLEASGWQ